jgi:hypothetical protein
MKKLSAEVELLGDIRMRQVAGLSGREARVFRTKNHVTYELRWCLRVVAQWDLLGLKN